VADAVFPPVAVARLEEMHPALEDDGARRAEALLLTLLLGPELADLLPGEQVVAFRDADRPTRGSVGRRPFESEKGQRKIQEVSAAERDHLGIL
jgi:hypothetical protein